MKVKRSLQDRIRGWFPQEPLLKKTMLGLYQCHGLDDNYRRLLLTGLNVTIILAIVLSSFRDISLTSYWVISILAIAVFTVLYGLGGRVQQTLRIRAMERHYDKFEKEQQS